MIQEQLSSLPSVIFKSDERSPLHQKVEVASLDKECCYYINQSGQVEVEIYKQKNKNQKEEEKVEPSRHRLLPTI